MAGGHPLARLKANGAEGHEKCVASHACDTSSIEYIGGREIGEEWRVSKKGKTVSGQRQSTSKFIAAMNAYWSAGKHPGDYRKMLPMVVSHFSEKVIATSRRTA
jgi:hypothetical protein